MSKQDEAFEKWAENNIRPYGPDEMRIARQSFAAGRDAEQKRILEIVEEVKTAQYPPEFFRSDGYDLDTCDEITRRIKEQEK